MSFSSEVKVELSKINNLANKDQVYAEFIGYILTINSTIGTKKIKYSTESEYNINRYNKLLKNLDIDYDIKIQGKVYYITCKNKLELKEESIDLKSLDNRSLIRGMFMGSGSINNPNNTYHLEMILKKEVVVDYVCEILKEYDIQVKTLKRKKGCSIYIKDGEEISKFLAFIGANSSVLKFEEIRVVKETRNNINRIVNCETANLNKTINAAVEQINAINKIIEKDRLNDLTEKDKEIAILRIENPEASLVELGRMLDTPIGKSGVNHRLKRIIEFAKSI